MITKPKLLISFLLTIIIICTFILPSLGNDTIYVWSNSSTPINETNKNNTINNSKTNDNTVATSTKEDTSNSLNLESPSAILIEQSTGQILYEHNSHEQLRPASVTKVMSILLIMEALDSRKNFYYRFSTML